MTRFYKETSNTSRILLPEIRNSEIRLIIHAKGCRNCNDSLQTAWYNFEGLLRTDEMQDEFMLGMSMVMNTWQLVEAGADKIGCSSRNFCELGFNGSVWGEGAALVVDMLARVMIRWSSEDEKEEYELTRAMNVGISEGKYYREDFEYIACDELFKES